MRRLRYLGILARDVWTFARAHKAYWILPLLVLLALLAAVLATGNAVAPFVYTLF